MRKIVVTAPYRVEIQELPDPPMQPGFVRVQPTHLGISVGTELNTYRGGVNWHSGREPKTGLFHRDADQGRWSYPASVGYANIGVVTEVASDVCSLAPGQRVFSNFSHMTPLVGSAQRFSVVAEGVDPRKYLFLQLVRTAVNVVHHAHPVLGDAAAVLGLGAVGLITIQVLRLAGVQRIFAFDPVESRRELARHLGADVVADPNEQDPAMTVRHHHAGQGTDLAIECAGHAGALQTATRCVDRRGRVVMASMPSQAAPFHFGQEMHFSAITLTGANVTQPPHDLGPQWNLDRQERLAQALLPRLDLLPLISRELPLQQAAMAYQLLDQNPGEFVSIVLTCDA